VFNIRTTDANGKPVSAEVSLSVVDKAVLALAQNFGADIVEAFYGKRDLAVKTSQSLTVFIERVNRREDFGGGGGDGEEVRKIFPDIAYWNPTIVTDANGNASVEVKLPDNLTTWTAIANGVTAQTQVGKGTGETMVTKDLIVRPVLPRFLNVGDQATLGAIIRNSTERAQNVTVTISATTISLIAPLTRTLTIGAGQSATLSWVANVPKMPNLPNVPNVPISTTITISARGETVRDAVQISLPIEPFGDKRVVTNAGQLDENETRFTINVPNDATFATIKLSASPSLAAGLIDSLEYLTGFPYGCVEQTMSRFLPSVLVKQALDKLQIKHNKIEKELPKQVEDGLTRLYAFQHEDGGWGWWESDDSQPYETAYVLYGLVQAKKAGYKVDENAIKRATKFLRQPMVDTNDYDLKVYIAYVLAEAGDGDAALARAMIEKQDKMSLNSRALLALLLKSVGEEAKAKEIVSALAKLATETTTTAYWRESDAARNRWEYFISDGRTTATMLRALLALDPQSPLITKTVRYLMLNRLGGYWRTTQETAQVLIALTDYLAQSRELEANFTYEVFVDGKSVAKETVRRENITQGREIVLRLAPGNREVRIVKQGTGRVYYASALTYYAEVEKVGAAKSLDGPTISREYLDPKTNKPLTSFKVGDVVRVKLTVNVPRESWYMMITDPLPAGFEAINYSLNTSGIEPGGERFYWSRPELRDNRAVFFTTYLWKGKHTYSYLIRATTSGTFRALPAEVTPMYEPEVWGRSASVEMVVRP